MHPLSMHLLRQCGTSMTLHNIEDYRRCPISGCSYIFEWSSEKIRHLQLCHKDKCIHCYLDLDKDHILLRHPDKCSLCSENIDSFTFAEKISHLNRFHRNISHKALEALV